MAQNITMKQVPNGTVTAKDDRIVYDANLADSGIIYGCEISYTGNNMIHINAGYGIIKGGLFEIEDHTEYVEFAESGTLNGQIYLHLDLSADDKLTIVKETAASLHPMTQNTNANFENGIYEMQLCTFEATATTLQNVTQTFSVVSAGVLDSLAEISANTTPGLKAGALAVKQLNINLTANSKSFIFDYHDGKYGYNTNPNRGADTFVPFSSLDISNFSISYYFSPYGGERDYSETITDDCILLIIGNVSRDANSSEISRLITYKRNNQNISMTDIIMPNGGTNDGAYQKYAILKANKNDVISGHIISYGRSNIVMLVKITP